MILDSSKRTIIEPSEAAQYVNDLRDQINDHLDHWAHLKINTVFSEKGTVESITLTRWVDKE